uniref:Uncharacterized protein n=1 Tax=viral metagenome TaxID=1070528 RepID=A0A6M3LNW2_9ZZZZ
MNKPWLTVETISPPRTLTNWRALPLALLYAPVLLCLVLVTLTRAVVLLPLAWATGRLKIASQKPRLYRLHWKAVKTGATGQGTSLFTYAEARQICDGLNRQNKVWTTHWIEEVKRCQRQTT